MYLILNVNRRSDNKYKQQLNFVTLLSCDDKYSLLKIIVMSAGENHMYHL